jgi:hypothetical protein
MTKISAQILAFHMAKPVMQPSIRTTGPSLPFVHLMLFSWKTERTSGDFSFHVAFLLLLKLDYL